MHIPFVWYMPYRFAMYVFFVSAMRSYTHGAHSVDHTCVLSFIQLHPLRLFGPKSRHNAASPPHQPQAVQRQGGPFRANRTVKLCQFSPIVATSLDLSVPTSWFRCRGGEKGAFYRLRSRLPLSASRHHTTLRPA